MVHKKENMSVYLELNFEVEKIKLNLTYLKMKRKNNGLNNVVKQTNEK